MGKKDLWIVAGALLLAVIIAITQMMPQVISTGSWGLSFGKEGVAPSGPCDQKTLAQYDAAYLGNTQEKVLYLTFDAGYENGYTADILDVLKKHQAPAAFFLVGHYVEKNPDLVRRMVEDGHTVGNHTLHHYDMSKLSQKDTFQAELTGLEEIFRSVTGQELPKYYRPPQGIYSRENLEMAKELGYKTVFWSLAYVDWNNDAQPTSRKQLPPARNMLP